MNPVRQMTFDARPVAPQFLDGNPITDGMANLFASAINAPIAAGQIRHQRELEARQQMLQDQEIARQSMLDDRAVQWHNQEQATRGRNTALEVARQNRQDGMTKAWHDAQIGNLKADNARQMAGMFGTGLNNVAARGIDAVKAMRGLFGGGRSSKTGAAKEPKPEVRNFGTDMAPNWRQWDGAAWKPIDMGEQSPTNAMGVIQETNPQLAEVMLGADRQANPIPWAGQQAQQPAAAGPVAPRPPEWEAAKIDMGGIDSWHAMAKQNPQAFAQQLTQLKASNDPRYPIIIAELRKRTGR